jgi:hypothetical protein
MKNIIIFSIAIMVVTATASTWACETCGCQDGKKAVKAGTAEQHTHASGEAETKKAHRSMKKGENKQAECCGTCTEKKKGGKNCSAGEKKCSASKGQTCKAEK